MIDIRRLFPLETQPDMLRDYSKHYHRSVNLPAEASHSEPPFVLADGQRVVKLIYERLVARPDRLYGSDIGSSYQRQGLKLSKHFKPL